MFPLSERGEHVVWHSNGVCRSTAARFLLVCQMKLAGCCVLGDGVFTRIGSCVTVKTSVFGLALLMSSFDRSSSPSVHVSYIVLTTAGKLTLFAQPLTPRISGFPRPI